MNGECMLSIKKLYSHQDAGHPFLPVPSDRMGLKTDTGWQKLSGDGSPMPHSPMPHSNCSMPDGILRRFVAPRLAPGALFPQPVVRIRA